MPDWSDDDDEPVGVESNVLLGVPDGPVDDPTDITDAAVSRIGGHPAFLPSREPSLESSLCKVCSFPMHLLLQIWCPFEDSPRDRALYVWGCSRGGCQKKDGSVRAWRGLRFNEKYAAKLERKLAKKREREKAQATEQTKPKTNPFSTTTSAPTIPTNPFALGNQIFGASTTSPVAPSPSPSAEGLASEDDSDSDNESDASQQSLTVALAAATLDDSPWKAASAYDPVYLSTTSEYLPPATQPKLPAGVKIVHPDKESKNDATWSEAYENSLEIDNVFERFSTRVSYESEQCLRYELGGTPLPFAKDDIFNRLFPEPTSKTTTVSKSVFTVVSQPPKRTFSPSTGVIPPCPICKSARVFECQLMPNLINVLKNSTADQPGNQDQRHKKTGELTDGERKKAVQEALRGGGDGMSWGTVMIFSCEKDCCYVTTEDKKDAKECWREEYVLVQWDT